MSRRNSEVRGQKSEYSRPDVKSALLGSLPTATEKEHGEPKKIPVFSMGFSRGSGSFTDSEFWLLTPEFYV
jgi:hypothetical protein